MIDAAILTTLIPGSVWQREGKKKITTVTVLTITNTSLRSELQEQHPPQVVFVTEGGDVLSQDVDFFLKKRTYVNINSPVESLIAKITELCIPVDDEEIDIDSIELPSGDGLSETSEGEESGTSEPAAEGDSAPEEAVYPFALTNAEHPLAGLLAEQFVSYSESPWLGDMVLHTLKFSLEEIAMEDLQAVFGVEANGYTITSWGEQTEVPGNDKVTVGLEVRGSQSYGCVYSVTDPAVVSEPAKNDAVEMIPVATPVVISAADTAAVDATTITVTD